MYFSHVRRKQDRDYYIFAMKESEENNKDLWEPWDLELALVEIAIY